jgi:hypothetical protein
MAATGRGLLQRSAIESARLPARCGCNTTCSDGVQPREAPSHQMGLLKSNSGSATARPSPSPTP